MLLFDLTLVAELAAWTSVAELAFVTAVVELAAWLSIKVSTKVKSWARAFSNLASYAASSLMASFGGTSSPPSSGETFGEPRTTGAKSIESVVWPFHGGASLPSRDGNRRSPIASSAP